MKYVGMPTLTALHDWWERNGRPDVVELNARQTTLLLRKILDEQELWKNVEFKVNSLNHEYQ